jgi:hypothetical protein
MKEMLRPLPGETEWDWQCRVLGPPEDWPRMRFGEVIRRLGIGYDGPADAVPVEIWLKWLHKCKPKPPRPVSARRYESSFKPGDAARVGVALGGRRPANGTGYYWMCLCPCHGDKNPSLSIRDGHSQLLVHCFAGCDADNILRELRRRGLLR